MTTIKTVGCGGRYSALGFVPCHVCLSRNDGTRCEDVLKAAGYQGKHEEWWTVRRSVAKLSTTITKVFFEMKMQDLERDGYFIEYKEFKPFWKKRIDNLLQKIDLRCWGIKSRPYPEIVFLVGNKPYRFKVVHIWWNDSYIPDRYKSAITTEKFFGIKCVKIPEEQVICSGAGNSCHNITCDHFGAHKKTQHCSDVCKENHCEGVDA